MMRDLSRKTISAGIVLFAVAVMAPWVANAQDDLRTASEVIKKQRQLSDAEALDMLTEKLRIDGEELKFKQAYVAKFMQVLPVRKVVRFYQAEHRFDTAANSELYRNIPLIR